MLVLGGLIGAGLNRKQALGQVRQLDRIERNRFKEGADRPAAAHTSIREYRSIDDAGNPLSAYTPKIRYGAIHACRHGFLAGDVDCAGDRFIILLEREDL